MCSYRVRISGENILLFADGRYAPFGFYIHIDVKSNSVDRAKVQAKKTVVSLLRKKGNVDQNSIDQIHLVVDEIARIDSSSDIQQGFIWYPLTRN